MGYIQNEKHFVNILNKALGKDEAVNTPKLLPAQFYVSQIYRKGDGEAFTWDLHQQGARLLEEDNVMKWLSSHGNGVERLLKESPFSQQATQEFNDLVSDLETVPGVYNFCREDDKSLYIGKSIRLGQRIITSIQRFVEYDRPIFVKHIVAQSKNDISVLEAYFIAKLTPPYNIDGAFGDCLHYTLDPIPEWSGKVQAYRVVHNNEG